MEPKLNHNKTCSRGHKYKWAGPCSRCWPGHKTFKMRAEVWLYLGMAGWHFVTLPRKQSEIIRKRFGALAGGWGSLPVIATIGETSWKTSIFPDKKAKAYLLPLKADVRKKEKIENGDNIKFTIEIVV